MRQAYFQVRFAVSNRPYFYSTSLIGIYLVMSVPNDSYLRTFDGVIWGYLEKNMIFPKSDIMSLNTIFDIF